MPILVRSWNLFHGNTHPPERRSHLREMVELVVADAPDVVCLQEVPVWALPHLESWSRYRAIPAVTRHGLRPVALAGWITRLDNGLLRSAITGQANVALVGRNHEVEDLGHIQISQGPLERRVCLAVRVAEMIVANLHTSSIDEDGRAQDEVAHAELGRAREFAEGLADGRAVTIAGDFNLAGLGLTGYSAPGPGIDQVLVRGAPASPLVVWPTERRERHGRVLSDHAPVEVAIG
jgi:endonuclease/exonuclease/phosphatase family metal-dependent hydrolase